MTVTKQLDLSQPASFGVDLRRQVRLAEFTTMKVGGPADYFVTVSTVSQLIKLVRWARAQSLPYFVLGGGSNILISDAGIRGLVLYNRCRTVRIDAAALQCHGPLDERPYLFAESGAAMAGVARTSIKAGLTGLEWAVSVPGTIGGAVVGNAGAHGGEVKDTLVDLLLIDEEGEVRSLLVDELHYSYRDSALKRKQPLNAGYKAVVLSANFRLASGNAAESSARADGYLAHRRQTQPVEPSLGSTFVNPPGDYAGRLIEAAGLKGARAGGAEVSKLHANFIINRNGSATAADVLNLISQIQERVFAHAGVQLEPEVQLAGAWGQTIAAAGFV
jgi:UDP-N-acetylmuramate dehydrogenase